MVLPKYTLTVRCIPSRDKGNVLKYLLISHLDEYLFTHYYFIQVRVLTKYRWKKTHLVCFRWTLRPAVCDLLFECYDSIGEPYTVQRYTGPYLTFGPFAIRWKEPHAVVQHRSLFLSHWTLWFSPDKWLSNSTVITKHIHLRTKVRVLHVCLTLMEPVCFETLGRLASP